MGTITHERRKKYKSNAHYFSKCKFLLLPPSISNFRKVWQPIDMTPMDMTPTRDSDAGVRHFTHSHQPSSGTLASHIKVHQINLFGHFNLHKSSSPIISVCFLVSHTSKNCNRMRTSRLPTIRESRPCRGGGRAGGPCTVRSNLSKFEHWGESGSCMSSPREYFPWIYVSTIFNSQ